LEPRLQLAPGVPGIDALGASSAADWLGDGSGLETGDRLQVVWSGPVETIARIPLPGTPDERGLQRERPRGAGTGWLVLHRYSGGGAELMRARFTRPRSESLAARRWNLICHLRAHGLGAPELVAMGEGRPGESFLLERELEGFAPLPLVIASEPPAERRRLIVRSLGLTLAGLFRSGTWLPRLRPESILVQLDEAGGVRPGSEACAALEIESLRLEAGTLRALRLRRRRLPGVAFAELDRGRVLASVSARRRRRLLAALDRELPRSVTALERKKVLALATRVPHSS
jgi:hypothetical protein